MNQYKKMKELEARIVALEENITMQAKENIASFEAYQKLAETVNSIIRSMKGDETNAH